MGPWWYARQPSLASESEGPRDGKPCLETTSIDELLDKLAELPRFYPEYQDRRIVGVLASLYPDAGAINRATRNGVLVMGMGDEAMQLLNPDAVQWDDRPRPPAFD